MKKASLLGRGEFCEVSVTWLDAYLPTTFQQVEGTEKLLSFYCCVDIFHSGSGFMSLSVTAFDPRYSTHIRSVLSDFGANKVGDPYGEEEGVMRPLASFSVEILPPKITRPDSNVSLKSFI